MLRVSQTSGHRFAVVLIAAVVLTALPAPLLAAGSWSKTEIATHDLKDVAFVTRQTGWVVGASGKILKTTDGAVSWSTQNSETGQTLHGVDFVDPSTGWAVGAAGTVRSTTDGGETWITRNIGVPGTLLDVDFVDATHGWVVGNTTGFANLMLATTDGGETWLPQATHSGIGLVAVSFVDRLRGFAVGYADAAYRTEDGGATWVPMVIAPETLQGNTTESFFATVRSSMTDGFVAGYRGVIYRTADGGVTWSATGAMQGPVRDLAVSGATAFAVGDVGMVASSQDDGQTWIPQASGTVSGLTGVSAPSPDIAFAVGAGGKLVSYRDGSIERATMEVSLLPQHCPELPIRWVHEPGGVMTSAVAVDIDGDGETEVVAAGAMGIRALRPFTPTAQATIWYTPLQSPLNLIRVAETDGDPMPELVASTQGKYDDRTGILVLAAESGAVQWSHRLPGGTVSFELADFDGDELEDVAAITESRDLRLLSGISGDNLHAPLPFSARPRDLELADLDRDGSADILIVLEDGRAVALEGATARTLWTYQTDGILRSVTAGDLSGDGTPDIVVGGTGIPASVTPGRGDDSIPVGSRRGAIVSAIDGANGDLLWDYGHAHPGMHFDALALGDLTGDGTPDVVGHAARLDNSHLLALNGKGRQVQGVATGEPEILWRYATTSTNEPIQEAATPESLSLVDGDANGTLDAFTAQHSGDIYAINGSVPAASGADPTRPPTAQRMWLARRDMYMTQARPVTVDGRLFILALSADGLLALRNSATGDIEWAFDGGSVPALTASELDSSTPGHETGLGTWGGRVYGLDGDGNVMSPTSDVYLPDRIVDIAAANADGDDAKELLATSIDGTIAAIDPLDSTTVWSVKVDAVPTAIAAGNGTVVVGLQTGLLGLDARTGNEEWALPTSTPLYDIVHLPRADLFAAGEDGGTLRFLDPTGDQVAEGSSPHWMGTLAAGDLNGDAVEEIVAASGSNFRAYTIDGTSVWVMPSAQVTSDVAIGDMDGDTLGDVAGVAQGRSQGIRHDGTLMWDLTSLFTGGSAVVDLDNSPGGEALIGSHAIFHDGRVRAVRADGSVLADCPTATIPKGMAATDLDGDFGRDAVVTTREGTVYAVGHNDPSSIPSATASPSARPTWKPGDRGSYPLAPDDPFFNSPKDINGVPVMNADVQWGTLRIRAAEAWQEDRATGHGIRVAVLDSGVDMHHPDLGCPGKLDIVPGSDLVSRDSIPEDGYGHGTHVAGTLAACTNNGRGIAGVAPDATIIPIRVLDNVGTGTDETVIGGIDKAISADADVINLSLGWGGPSGLDLLGGFEEIDRALEEAAEQGIVIVAAAGNERFPLCSYPALAEDVICVGATDPRDVKTHYSTFANKMLRGGPALVAPGGSGTVFCDLDSEDILSLYPLELDETGASEDCDERPGYENMSGTSMAAPHVAGLAALLYDRLGGVRSPENATKVIDAMTSTAIDLGVSGSDPVYGSGRVDALTAVQSISVVDPDPSESPTDDPSESPTDDPTTGPTTPAAPSNLTARVASSSRIELAWTDNATSETAFAIERSLDGGDWVEIATAGQNATTYLDLGLAADTRYSYRVRAMNPSGHSPYSNAASATTMREQSGGGDPQQAPVAPSNLSATSTSPTRVDLSWTDSSSDENGFAIERSADSGATWQEIATTGRNQTSYLDSGLSPDTTYSYRVRAYNSVGHSPYSNTASAKTASQPSGGGTPPGGGGGGGNPSSSSPSPTQSSTAPVEQAVIGTATTTISTSEVLTTYNEGFELSGVVGRDAKCTGPLEIAVSRRVHGTNVYEAVASTTVDGAGNWGLQVVGQRSSSYVAEVKNTASCVGEASVPTDVLVRAKISVKVPMICGGNVRGQVLPVYEGSEVVLQRKTRGRWVEVASDALDAESRFVLKARKCGLHRVTWSQDGSPNEPARSRFRL